MPSGPSGWLASKLLVFGGSVHRKVSARFNFLFTAKNLLPRAGSFFSPRAPDLGLWGLSSATLKKRTRGDVFVTMPEMTRLPSPTPATRKPLAWSGTAALCLALSLFACDKNSKNADTAQPAAAAPEAAPSQAVQRRAAKAEPQAIAAQAPETGEGEEGSACAQGSDCESGICEGQGCGENELGQCMPKDRPCTYDLVQYCGCDGKTFESSGVCAGQRYQRKGACEEPAQD